MKKLKKHLSVSNVLAATALFVALGGSAYAAAKLTPGQVKTVNIATQAVTQQKLAGNSVTSGKIVNGQVINRDIGNGAVSGNKLGKEAVKTNKIAKKAVTATQLGPEAVTNAKLKNEAVSQAKLSSSLYGQLLKNVSYVTATSIVDSEERKTITVECPTGKEAIGGGARINGPAKTKAVVNETAPALGVGGSHFGWYASGLEVDGTEVGNWSVSAFAVCAQL